MPETMRLGAIAAGCFVVSIVAMLLAGLLYWMGLTFGWTAESAGIAAGMLTGITVLVGVVLAIVAYGEDWGQG